MRILGNRVLVSKIEEEKKEGFQTVEVQDNFVNKGKVEMVGFDFDVANDPYQAAKNKNLAQVGDTILFAKYSPDTQEIELEGKKMKLVKMEDVLAIL